MYIFALYNVIMFLSAHKFVMILTECIMYVNGRIECDSMAGDTINLCLFNIDIQFNPISFFRSIFKIHY